MQQKHVEHITHVHFEDSLHEVLEQETLESQIAARFQSDELNPHIIFIPAPHDTIVDCSYIHTTNYYAENRFLAFF